MNTYRLNVLADFLDKLPENKFNYSSVISRYDGNGNKSTCGSIGCAIGWCPAIPAFKKHVSWVSYNEFDESFNVSNISDASFVMSKNGNTNYCHIGSQLFDLSLTESAELFSPNEEYPDTSTPQEVANRIRKFVKNHNKVY